MLRGVKLAVPTLLLLCLALAGEAPRQQALQTQAAPQGVDGGTIVKAFVMPQLSFECVVAVVGAMNTCISPGTGGAVACGMALVRILRVCP